MWYKRQIANNCAGRSLETGVAIAKSVELDYSINERIVPRYKPAACVERIATWIDFQRPYAVVNHWPEVLIQKTRIDVVGKDVRLVDRKNLGDQIVKYR